MLLPSLNLPLEPPIVLPQVLFLDPPLGLFLHLYAASSPESCHAFIPGSVSGPTFGSFSQISPLDLLLQTPLDLFDGFCLGLEAVPMQTCADTLPGLQDAARVDPVRT